MVTEYDNVADELNAMLNGTHESEDVEPGDTNTEVNDEDTDHNDSDDTGTDTNVEAAELEQDTDDSELGEGEVNAPADNDGSQEPDGDDGGTDGEENESSDDSEDPTEKDPEGNEDNTETDTKADGADVETTGDIDYQKQYETLLEESKVAMDFREQLVGVKFKANGKEVKGFEDPKKIIQAQQMAYNYSDKMAGFKPYRKFNNALKERGMLDDSSKFDLAMSLIDGDKEALKQHIKNLDIDPMDLDMEDIKYAGESKTASRDVIAIEDALESAKASGVEDQVYNTVMKEWDDDSFRDFVNDTAIQDDLIAQMSNGDYDVVMSKVTEMGVLDNKFSGMKMVDKYRAAVNELNTATSAQVHREQAVEKEANEAQSYKAEQEAITTAESKAKIEAEAVASYKAEVNKKKNERAKLARDKASNASKPKNTSTNKGTKIDPMDYNGTELKGFLDDMMMGR